ncbi:hypothetical protein PV721_40635 [Streptomyces sp. MB09-01]|nr:hypothetical protein [Streptomyces sp. MB09-01]MDX3540501.1 hypothetical protein [Streptomyces sp. MB09-01]
MAAQQHRTTIRLTTRSSAARQRPARRDWLDQAQLAALAELGVDWAW